jgi:hypothetical protein
VRGPFLLQFRRLAVALVVAVGLAFVGSAVAASSTFGYATACTNGGAANDQWYICPDNPHNWTHGQAQQGAGYLSPITCVGLYNVGVSQCSGSDFENWDFGNAYQAYDPLYGVGLWETDSAPGATFGNSL